MKLTAKAKKLDIKKFKAQVREVYYAQRRAQLTPFVQEVAEFARVALQDITEKRFGHPSHGYSTEWERDKIAEMSGAATTGYDPAYRIEFDAPDEGRVSAVVRLRGNNPIFGWVDQGTDGNVSNKDRTFPIAYSTPRTMPGTIAVDMRQQYPETWVTIKAGRKIAGIEARDFLGEVCRLIHRKFGSRAKQLGVTLTLTITRADGSVEKDVK